MTTNFAQAFFYTTIGRMSLRIQEHISLKEFTTMKIGGTARYFAVVKRAEELQEAVIFAKEKEVPMVVLGGGSNILITDGELTVLVIKIEIKGMTFEEEMSSLLVTAGAGESWDGLVSLAVTKGLWGIENLSGIPGTVGAAPIQNIGAYGTEVKDVIEWVEVFNTKTEKTERLSGEACSFSYRDSVFKHAEGKAFIVIRVAFRLKKAGAPQLEYKDLKERFKMSDVGIKNGDIPSQPSLSEIRNAVIEIRSGKFPDLKEFGTAGSFFKNPIIPEAQFNELKGKFPNLPGFEVPVTHLGLKAKSYKLKAIKVPLAWILEHLCGLKGFKKGNVSLFERQPIVLVQNGFATAEEIEVFANEIIAQVKAKTGIDVEWEVQKMM